MKTTSHINGILRLFGIELHRVQRKSETPALHAKFSQTDLDECLAVVKRHTESGPDAQTWERSKRYLDPVRSSFYHSTADLIERTGCLNRGATVLDIGTYFGYLLRVLHERQPHARYFGTETNRTRLTITRELCPFAEISEGTIDTLAGEYDFVMLTEVLEHLVDPSAAVHQLEKIGKTLLFTIPDGRRDNLGSIHFNEQWGSYRGHINFWSPESWGYWLRKELPNRKIETGELPTKKLYAVVR